MSENFKINRPISPHLSIYKPQISTAVSIFHRISGICLLLGFLIINWWFIGWVSSGFLPCYTDLAKTIPAKIFYVLVSLGIFYHLCSGIRHLFWDVGMGFDRKTVDITAIAVVISSVALTCLYWLVIFIGN